MRNLNIASKRILILAFVLVGSGFWVFQNWQATQLAQARLAQAQSQFTLLKKWLYKAKQHGAEHYAERSFFADVPDMDWQQWLAEQAQLSGGQVLNWRKAEDQLHMTWQVNDVGQALAIGQAIHKTWMLSMYQWQIEFNQDSQHLVVQMRYQIDVR